MSAEKIQPDEHAIAVNMEQAKAALDHAKQIMTLATGSIVLLATVLDKAFAKPHGKDTLRVSLFAFIVSIICAVIVHAGGAFSKIYYSDDIDSPTGRFFGLMIVMMWLAFLIGIVSLALFASINL